MRRQNRVLVPVAMLALAIGAPQVGIAQAASASVQSDADGLVEIVVTAERRSENIQRAPLAIAVVTGDEIAKTNLSTIDDVLRLVPSVQMQPVSVNGDLEIAIRGIGTDGNTKAAATTVYVDGVAAYKPGDVFYDISRVEVLEGPQGTLYGGTATGGAVNIITNDPVNRFESAASLSYGNYSRLQAQGMVNLPASDTFAVRLAGNYLESDSYPTNSVLGIDEYGMRAKALWDPTTNFSLLLGIEHNRNTGLGVDAMALGTEGKPTGSRIPQAGNVDYENTRYSLHINADLGFALLTEIAGLQIATLDTLNTVQATPPAQLATLPNGRYVTEELRLANEPDSTLKWVGGVYYDSERSVTTVNILPDILKIVNTLDNHEIAGFGQVTYPVNDWLRVSVGGRYTEDTVISPQSVEFIIFGTPPTLFPFDRNFVHFDYQARVEEDLTADNLLYESVTTGYRPGSVAENGTAYSDETVTDFEVGSKNTLLNGKAISNLTLFYYHYSGFQSTFQENCVAGVNNGCYIYPVVAIPAKFIGLEYEGRYRVTPDDAFSLQPTYLHAKYTGNTEEQDPAGVVTALPTNGNTIPHAAKWHVTASYQHDFHLPDSNTLFVRGELAYTSQQIIEFGGCAYAQNQCTPAGNGSPADNAANYIQQGYTIANFSAGYQSSDGHWSVVGFVRNATNEIYKLSWSSPAAVVGDPRTFGVKVSTRW